MGTQPGPGPIAVGVNGTAASDAAVRYAVAEARRAGSSVKLVHVVPDYLPATRPFGMSLKDLAPTGRHLLQEANRTAHEEWPEVRVQAALVAGPWAPAIVHAAEGAEEIVLGHDPDPSLLRLATGSTVVAVASHAPVPVIAVAPGPREPSFGRMTVGIKFVPRSYGLLRLSFEQAAHRGLALHVVHAWAMPPGYEGLVVSPQEREEINKTESMGLDELVQGLAAEFVSVKASVQVLEGNPARVLQLASETSDLLLLSRRRHAFPRGHVGGTARALLRHSSCPVAIVPTADEPAHLPVAEA
ncbi:MAG TPA: universal stress protein [Marmoricola sp.]|nr:universal stress protein [Marmoricola sp.]